MLCGIYLLYVLLVIINKVGKRSRTDKATFGWTRMEVVGGLMNGTFLLAICFSIMLEAIHRFLEPASMYDSYIVIIITILSVYAIISGV